MGNQYYLAGSVMLETIWKTRHQDLIDLISPFVYYSVATVCAPHQIIDKRKVLEIIRTEFGFSDINIPVIEKVFRRNPSVFGRKNKAEFELLSSLDKEVEEIKKRRNECDKRLQILGKQIADYFSTHLKRKREYSVDEAIQSLQTFFSRQGTFLGTNQLEEHKMEMKDLETDYYIANYIFEKKDSGDVEYEYVLDLVKGYFLQAAIYLQAQNGNVISSTYKNVMFFYDTPFLLKLLKFKADLDNKDANELHNSLMKQKGKFYFFPQTQREIYNILTAYQRSIGKNSNITLEGLDAKRYTKSDVERLKNVWEANLSTEYGVKLKNSPGYIKKTNGSIDERFVIDEKGLRDFLSSNIHWSSVDSMEADIESLISIHQIRGEIKSEELEHTNSVFVTTNVSLAKLFNQYYRDKVDGQTFPLVITDFDLAALTWIKCGSTDELPERQLLRNAYMATQPTPEMMYQFGLVLEKMQEEGKVTEEIAVAIRASRYTKKEILFASFGNESNIDEDIVKKVEDKLREDFSNKARMDEKINAEHKRKDEQHKRIAKADQLAREKALREKSQYIKKHRIIARIIEVVVICISIIGTIMTWKGIIALSVFFILFAGVAVLSVIDTIRGKEDYVDRWIVRRANKKYDKTYEEKRKEYESIL